MANKKETPGGGSYGGDHEEMVAGISSSQTPGFDLMQNCDLPPPMKIFAGQDKTIVSPMNNVYGTIVGQKDKDVGVETAYDKSSENEKLKLLKTLRLSQTRAREAERKVAVLSKERNDLSNLVLQQSMQLFAYKQWLKMMEFQQTKLNKHQEMQELGCGTPKWDGNMLKEEDAKNKGEKGITWFVAVSICVGIAGVGILSFSSSYY